VRSLPKVPSPASGGPVRNMGVHGHGRDPPGNADLAERGGGLDYIEPTMSGICSLAALLWSRRYASFGRLLLDFLLSK